MAKKDGEGEVSIPRQNRRGRPSEGDLARLGEVRSLPDGPADAEGLTLRQRLILETIQAAVAERGYPPTIREMGEAVGLASPSSVTHQLKALEAKGFLSRDPKRPRALVVHLPGTERDAPAEARPAATGYDADVHVSRSVEVPIVGRIAAGGPILAEQHIEDVFPLPRDLVGEGDLFLLEVRGDSMVDAAICDGDYVVVREQRRDRRRHDRRRGHREDVQADGRPGVAAASQRGLLPHRRQRGDHPGQGDRSLASRLTAAAQATASGFRRRKADTAISGSVVDQNGGSEARRKLP
jgi:repressor LexA